MFAIVQGGGGARGAWQAGVLRFLVTELAQQLGGIPWPDLVSGSSIGSFNSAYLAGRDLDAMARFTRIWRELRFDDSFKVRSMDVLRVLLSTLRSAPGVALLDPSDLAQALRDNDPTRLSRAAIDRGDCKAFFVSTTRVDNGQNVLFADSREPLELGALLGTRVVQGPVDIEHIIASGSLPLLFPPTDIDGALYLDGGLRQNLPVRPVISAGADRVLVLELEAASEHLPRQREPTLSLPFLAGKSLNALVHDPIERELGESRRLNELLAWGTERYGPDFAEEARTRFDARPVQILAMRPSRDLGAIAAEVFLSRPPRTSIGVRLFLELLVDRANLELGEADLLSYMYLDHNYTAEIEQLGFEDARGNAEGLAALCCP